MRHSHYFVPEHEETADDAEPILTHWSDEFPHRIAEDAAEDFFSNRDGWECSWPKDFTIILESGEQKTFTVDMEARPVFTASGKK